MNTGESEGEREPRIKDWESAYLLITQLQRIVPVAKALDSAIGWFQFQYSSYYTSPQSSFASPPTLENLAIACSRFLQSYTDSLHGEFLEIKRQLGSKINELATVNWLRLHACSLWACIQSDQRENGIERTVQEINQLITAKQSDSSGLDYSSYYPAIKEMIEELEDDNEIATILETTDVAYIAQSTEVPKVGFPECLSPVPTFCAVDALITTEQLAKLVGIKPRSFANKLSETRRSPNNSDHPPQAKVSGGSRSNAYAYMEIRPWLLNTWPDCNARFPENYSDAMKILNDG